MKILVGILLLLNLGLGLWLYEPPAGARLAPPSIHPNRLMVVARGEAVPVPTPAPLRPASSSPSPQAGAAAPASPPPASGKGRAATSESAHPQSIPSVIEKTAFVQKTQKTQSSTRPQAAPAANRCWELGPLSDRPQALALLHRLHLKGIVFKRIGPAAYRVFLSVGPAWPTRKTLRRLGVKGAYTTHGPAGGEVLSLGVFLQKKAALREVGLLRKGGIHPRMAAFGAPDHYFARVMLRPVSAHFWRSVGTGHAVCSGRRAPAS